MNYLGGRFEHGQREGLIPAGQPRVLAQRLLMGMCLVLFSSLFFIGAYTVISWII